MNITQALKTDIALVGDMRVTAGGDLQTISGLDNLKAALLHRLLTVPGTLIHRPTYGVGLLQYENAPTSFAIQNKLATDITHQFAQDPRVDSVSSVSFKSDDTTPEKMILSVVVQVVGYTEQTMVFTPFVGGS